MINFIIKRKERKIKNLSCDINVVVGQIEHGLSWALNFLGDPRSTPHLSDDTTSNKEAVLF